MGKTGDAMTTNSDSGPNKFDSHALFCDDKQYTPIPRFFFRLWRAYGGPGALPSSFWKTLFFLLDATIGASLEGVKGTKSQSQIPVDHHESAKWIAALDGYGLIGVEYSNSRKPVASKFTFNADRTEADWLNFVLLLCQGYRDGEFSRDRTAEDIREIFACFKNLAGAAKPILANTSELPRLSQAWLDALPNYDDVLSRPKKGGE